MEHAVGDELETGGRERRPLLVLVHLEELQDRVRVENGIETVDHLAAAVRQPELGRIHVVAGAEQAAEGPRHEVAPVVEMEVRDDDRVQSWPRLEPPQPRQNARAAVEQEPPAVLLDEIARLGAARVGPGGRAADDVDAHGLSSLQRGGYSHGEAQLCITAPWPEPQSTRLKKVPLFAGLDDKELQQIASSMRERKFRAGDTVTQEGAGGVGFFVVESGEAEVNVGGETKGKVGPGDYFGEIALINESPRTATLTARTDMLCYGMTPWDFRPLVESNSTIAWKLLTAMAEKMR